MCAFSLEHTITFFSASPCDAFSLAGAHVGERSCGVSPQNYPPIVHSDFASQDDKQSKAVWSFVRHLIGLIKLIAAGKLGAEQRSNGSCFGGGGGCCVFILGVGARAGLASWRSPERTVGVKPLKACKICRRAHPGHRRSGAARWSRRRPRSTSLSWGSPCESLFRSHNWRWSDCSPGRRSERVRPGQPWLPVCHKTARITSLGEELLPLVVNPGPPSLAWPGPVASLLGYFFGWTPSVCVLFSRPSDTRAASLKETANEAPADTNSHTIARFFLATFRLNAAYVSGLLFINAVPPLGSLLADMFPLLYRTESSAARTYGCLTLYNCDVTPHRQSSNERAGPQPSPQFLQRRCDWSAQVLRRACFHVSCCCLSSIWRVI